MEKVNIHAAISTQDMSNVQLQSVFDHFRSAAYKPAFDKYIGKETNMNKFRKLLSNNNEELKNFGNNNPKTNLQSVMFCFDNSNKFICMDNILSPSLHDIILPDNVENIIKREYRFKFA